MVIRATKENKKEKEYMESGYVRRGYAAILNLEIRKDLI